MVGLKGFMNYKQNFGIVPAVGVMEWMVRQACDADKKHPLRKKLTLEVVLEYQSRKEKILK